MFAVQAVTLSLYKTIQVKQPGVWTCNNCTLSKLPFYKVKDLATLDSTTEWNVDTLRESGLDIDPHLDAPIERQKQLSFMHLNTQSMTTTFDDLYHIIQRYEFDVVMLSETWLKDNPQLLSHVSIPGYASEFRNRDKIKGGGVGAYIKENVKYKKRKDIESKYPEMEHLWLEIQGRNKNSRLLIGTIYRSTTILTTQLWLTQMENMLSDLSTSWDGLLIITGDLNIDILKPNAPLTKQYINLLYMFNLTQHMEKATRVTCVSESLIDHIISNNPKRVTYTDVLPCSNVSDHDAPYACLNIRVERFVPRLKIIRNERGFKEEEYIRDFASLPFGIIEVVDDPEEKLEMFTNLITECIERHAPLKHTKITCPPALWLQEEEIKSLQNQRNLLRHKAHSNKTQDNWQAFRDVRNRLKTKIKEAKRLFINTALSSTKPKVVWRVIHHILNPSSQPLRLDVNKLNAYSTETAQRTTGNSNVGTKEDLLNFIDSLPPGSIEQESFTLHHVTYKEVIRTIRSDTSTGPDQIPIKYLKPVAESIAGPLTHIINSFIDQLLFPNAWKIARITPIPSKTSILF